MSGNLPSIGQADTGSQAWEQRLIERLRIQHYAWRTEQTYREWAWRLADFVGPRDLAEATGEDVKAFLSELAVKGRVSKSTQKQALNALVIARNLERVADHATNVAEDVIFWVRGADVRHNVNPATETKSDQREMKPLRP